VVLSQTKCHTLSSLVVCFNICGSVHRAFVVKIIPTRCNNCVLFFAMLLLYMFRVKIPPIITGPLSGRHDAEQQDIDYLQLHTTLTDRTTLLRTNLLTKCACLPVAIYSTCTPEKNIHRTTQWQARRRTTRQ